MRTHLENDTLLPRGWSEARPPRWLTRPRQGQRTTRRGESQHLTLTSRASAEPAYARGRQPARTLVGSSALRVVLVVTRAEKSLCEAHAKMTASAHTLEGMLHWGWPLAVVAGGRWRWSLGGSGYARGSTRCGAARGRATPPGSRALSCRLVS